MFHLRRRAVKQVAWSLVRRRNRRVQLMSRPILPSFGAIGRAFGRLRVLAPVAAVVGLISLLAGGVYGARYWMTRSPHFKLARIRVSPLKHLDEGAILARVGVVPGMNVFAIDLPGVVREVSREPWVASAAARLELPATLIVDVIERSPAVLVSLGALYLVDDSGVVFKRATPEETANLPVVTGIARELFVAAPEPAKRQLRQAVEIARIFSKNESRPRLGELHLASGAITAFTAEGAVGIRLGRLDDSLADRLARFDRVWRELKSSNQKPRFIYLDNRSRPDRVTVKLAQVAPRPEHDSDKQD